VAVSVSSSICRTPRTKAACDAVWRSETIFPPPTSAWGAVSVVERALTWAGGARMDPLWMAPLEPGLEHACEVHRTPPPASWLRLKLASSTSGHEPGGTFFTSTSGSIVTFYLITTAWLADEFASKVSPMVARAVPAWETHRWPYGKPLWKRAGKQPLMLFSSMHFGPQQPRVDAMRVDVAGSRASSSSVLRVTCEKRDPLTSCAACMPSGLGMQCSVEQRTLSDSVLCNQRHAEPCFALYHASVCLSSDGRQSKLPAYCLNKEC
jgi:hypothetical protein